MDEEQKACFHIPGLETSTPGGRLNAYDQADLIKQVSTVKHAPQSFAVKNETMETRSIYEELSAISEEIMECRKAAITQIL